MAQELKLDVTICTYLIWRSQYSLAEAPCPPLRYPDDAVKNSHRLVALGTKVLKAGPPEGVCLLLYVLAKLKGKANASLKHIFQVYSVFLRRPKSIKIQLQVDYCLLSGVTSVDLVKFGVVRLKTLRLSPPTTT